MAVKSVKGKIKEEELKTMFSETFQLIARSGVGLTKIVLEFDHEKAEEILFAYQDKDLDEQYQLAVGNSNLT
jgi:hypothetical protein